MAKPTKSNSSPVLPRALKPGETIGVVSVSAPEAHLFPDEFQTGIKVLESFGYKVRVAPHASSVRGYLAGSPKELADDIHRMFQDSTIAALICAGGGSNANRLLSELDFELVRKHPKIFMGASNPTVLLNGFRECSGLITFHGPSVVWDWGQDQSPAMTSQHCMSVLTGQLSAGRIVEPRLNWLRKGRCTGELVGGNLTSLMGLVGTPWEPRWSGRILLWEDIGISIEQVDAMLTQLRSCGVFDQISGMVVGELVDIEESGGWGILELLNDLLPSDGLPVAVGLPFGHTPEKYTLPVGGRVQMDSESETLELLDLPRV